jgi:hypothetical protein
MNKVIPGIVLCLILAACSSAPVPPVNIPGPEAISPEAPPEKPAMLILPKEGMNAYTAGYNCIPHLPTADLEPYNKAYYNCEFFHDLMDRVSKDDPNYVNASMWVYGYHRWWKDHQALVEEKERKDYLKGKKN